MDTTPFEVFFGRKLNIGRLEEFGKKHWVQVLDQHRTKLDLKLEQHIFTGIAPNTKAWRYYNVHTCHIQTSHNIIFDATDNAVHPCPDDDDLPPAPAPRIVPKAMELDADVWQSTRLAGKPGLDYCRMHEGEWILSAMEIMTEPDSYAEALHHGDYPIWQKAMETEMAQHAEVGTWTLVDLPVGKNVVGCRWVYVVKTDAKGNFDLSKARLVTQGFTQWPSIDYLDVMSLVVKLDSLWLILAIAIQKGWEIEMMDIKGAYLNSTLDEEIYMCQPDSFNDKSGHILKLHQAIYSLKQSVHSWYKKLMTVLFNDRFTWSYADDCVFYKKMGDWLSIITIYMDNLSLFTSTKVLMASIKTLLHSNFTMKDLSKMLKILGIRVKIDPHHNFIKLSQGHYIDIIIQQFNLDRAPPVDTPILHDIKFLKPCPDGDPAPDKPYAQAIGSLMYAILGSHPDIAFAVQQLSQHTHDFSQAHWTAVKRVIRYLKGTHDAGIVLHCLTLTPLIEIYSDANFVGLADSHSVGGFLCKYHGCIVTWVSKKQPQIALSMTKSESIALLPGSKHPLWIRHFLQELGLPLAASIHIHCDC